MRSLDRAVGGGVTIVALCLYFWTLCPTVYWYDSAEFAAKAAVLGVPHPPGYPLYTLIAHVFTWLPGEPAYGVNIMSAVFGAASVGLVYLVQRLVDVPPLCAAPGALLLGAGPIAWENAVVAEVYTPGLAFTLAVLALLLVGFRRRKAWPLIAAALVAGLGLGMHMSIATCGLGFAVLVLGTKVELRARVLTALSAPFAVALGALVFLYIPMRSPNWAGTPRQWRNFYKNAAGGRFKNFFFERYDFGEYWGRMVDAVVLQLHWVGIALAVAGAIVLIRRAPVIGAALVLAAVGNLWFFFNYGVHDIEPFFLPAVAVACVLVGAAVTGAASRLESRSRHAGWAVPLAVALLPFGLAVRAYPSVDRSATWEAREYAKALAQTLPEGAIIIKHNKPEEWKRYAVLLYYREALGQLRDVQIMTRPNRREARDAIESSAYVFVLDDISTIRGRYRIEPVGVAYRVVRVR